MLILTLIQNVALLIALTAGFEVFMARFRRGTLIYQLLVGLLFGGVAVVSMMTPFRWSEGIIFDGRSIIICVSGMFGGPLAALISTLMAGSYRMWLGGVGAPVGVAVIAEAALVGVGSYYLRQRLGRAYRGWELWGIGLLVHVIMVALFLLLPNGTAVVRQVGVVTLVLYPPALMLVCLLFQDQEAHVQSSWLLRESEERYRTLVEQASDGIFVVDAQRNVVDVNPSGCAMLGYSREELCQRNLNELIYAEDLPGTEQHFAAMQQGKTVRMEHRLVHRDGSLVAVEVSGRKLPDGRLQGIVRDVGERRRAQAALAAREKLLNKILDILPVGLWLADRQGRLVRSNPEGRRIWGAEPLVGREEYGVFRARRLPSGEEVAADDWALVHTINEGATVLGEMLEIDAFDGQKRAILNYCAPVLDEEGKVEAAVIVNLDITALRKAEEEKERLSAQLLQAQKMESIGRLAGGVAHDFNNWLAVILGRVEKVLPRLSPQDAIYNDLMEIRKAAERAANLTRQLLAFARQQTAQPRLLDLNTTISNMLTMLRRLIGEDIELIWRPGDGLWAVEMDPSQVDQVLANLLVNARDAINGVGQVVIETRNVVCDARYQTADVSFIPGEYVLLTVSDTGSGMDEQVQSHLFEPFFTTKEVGKGTGLGLATVYGIVRQNGGWIHVYSEPEKGTTFHIYLPRASGQAAKEEEEGLHPALAERPGGSETVLLVEDELPLLEMAADTLSELGYVVLTANSPGDALRLVQGEDSAIDLLITDVIMPGMNGRELAEQLRALQPQMRCLFMSGYTADIIANHGMLEEGVSFIQKPFTLDGLASSVRRALEAGRQGQ
ncbi:MAG: PAS domain S-box protein [Anaerolineae bacterium]|nr:PAS domain S-box protein [Anaerolineae bacterium]